MATRSFILLLFLGKISFAGMAVGAAAGMSHDPSVSFAYSVYLYYKFDEQVMLGLNSGQQQQGIPVLGSVYMRLPLGSVFMPVATGDLGYFMHDQDSGLLWKAGGGIDWKNGERSSILLLGGYEKKGAEANIYSRLGLLLEF
ncbi:hypothetical protein ACFL5V_05245 [Fibrobacterota bacterium]